MLLWLADYLSQFYSPFSVVQYLTLRGSHDCHSVWSNIHWLIFSCRAGKLQESQHSRTTFELDFFLVVEIDDVDPFHERLDL